MSDGTNCAMFFLVYILFTEIILGTGCRPRATNSDVKCRVNKAYSEWSTVYSIGLVLYVVYHHNMEH